MTQIVQFKTFFLLIRILLPLVSVGCSVNQTQIDYAFSNQLRQSSVKADLWMLQSQKPSGWLPYFYDPASDVRERGNNDLIQLAAARRLSQLAVTRSPFKNAHERQLATIFRYWHRDKAVTEMLTFNRRSSLGANAQWLRVLMVSPFASTYEPVIAALASRIRAQFQLPEGFPERLDSKTTNSDFLQQYYAGLATLALLEHGDLYQDSKSLEIANKSLVLLNQKTEASKDPIHPALIPWHVLALSKYYRVSEDPTFLPTLFRLTNNLTDLQSDRDFPGRFYSSKYSRFGQPNTARDALGTLALLHSLEIATTSENQRIAERYRKMARLALTNLVSLQYRLGSVSVFPKPREAIGALRFRHHESRIRLDATAFAAEAFEKAAELSSKGRL